MSKNKKKIIKYFKRRAKYFALAFIFFMLGASATILAFFALNNGKIQNSIENSSLGMSSNSNLESNASSVSIDSLECASKILDENLTDPYPKMPTLIDKINTAGISIFSRASGNYFYTVNNEGNWNVKFLKGVNMGLTLPTTNLDNPDIPYETYKSWFKLIHQMNANTIKVFTVMNPHFYNAFYDYNKENPDNPLYLLQGIWVNENDMYSIGDAYGKNNKILNDFKRTAREIVDIIHGRSDYTSYGDLENAVYDKDISKYVMGFILGLEWDVNFIQKTNDNNPGRKSFTGTYLKTQNASAFEAFLCNTGNSLIEYQTQKYKTQTPIAFLNWQTTDILTHTNEPFLEEDELSLDTNHIKSTKNYYTGQFAAIDIYPYYPEFMNYQKEYVSYKDPQGRINPYRAYLKDLKNVYKMPVVVAEFGVPTSRGIAHKSITGFNQGGINEKAQGEMIISMLKDIAKEGYAGGMIFSWQDEWFKQTWNTVKYYAEDTTKRVPNRQSAEQSYGILSYELLPSKPLEQAFYPDGKTPEWTKVKSFIKLDANGKLLNQSVTTGAQNPNGNSQNISSGLQSQTTKIPLLDHTVSLQSDALNILIKWDNTKFNPLKDDIAVAMGTTKRGSLSYKSAKINFTKPTDFVLVLNGTSGTRIYVDSYYDVFYNQYMVTKKVFPLASGIPRQNSGVYNVIRQLLSSEMYLPVSKKTIPPVFYESGLLKSGNANPDSLHYDSLADFNITSDFAEIKIPWTLLNVMSLPEKARIADFYKKGKIDFESFNTMDIGIGLINKSSETNIEMLSINLPDLGRTIYKERLKQSYDIIKKQLADIFK